MQEGCYVSVGELGDVATLQRFSGAWWYPGNVARSPHFLAHPLQKRNSLFAFLLVSLRCERKCGRGGGFLSNEPMITGLIAHILGGQLTVSVDLRTGGTQATCLISNIHQPYSVGTDELYSKREGYKPMGRQSLISIPLFPLPPPSLSSSAPVFSLIYF